MILLLHQSLRRNNCCVVALSLVHLYLFLVYVLWLRSTDEVLYLPTKESTYDSGLLILWVGIYWKFSQESLEDCQTEVVIDTCKISGDSFSVAERVRETLPCQLRPRGLNFLRTSVCCLALIWNGIKSKFHKLDCSNQSGVPSAPLSALLKMTPIAHSSWNESIPAWFNNSSYFPKLYWMYLVGLISPHPSIWTIGYMR